jgi:hypothetical protein
MDDLLPRADISGAIAPHVAALGSANWKERKAALDEIDAAIASAGGRIQANVSTRGGQVGVGQWRAVGKSEAGGRVPG